MTAPSPENLKTLFEFVFKGFDAMEYKVEFVLLFKLVTSYKLRSLGVNFQDELTRLLGAFVDRSTLTTILSRVPIQHSIKL